MRTKVLFLIAATIIMAACSNQESVEPESTMITKTTVSNIRSYEEALKIAQASISILDGSKSPTRGLSKSRKIDMNDRYVVKLDAKTRSGLNINDTLIYVFNFENNEGFTLISASKSTEGLLAITEKGQFVPNVRSENEGFNLFLDLAKQYIINRGITEIDTTEVLDGADTVYVHNITGPYLSVEWGQYRPEGEFCFNGLSGCAATAMAQVMSYYEYPQFMNLTYYGSDVSTQSFNWTQMKAHTAEHPLSLPSCNSDIHKSISRLCRQLGQRAGSSYQNGMTNTMSDSIRPCMLYYGYQTSTTSYGDWSVISPDVIKGALNNGKLLFVKGAEYIGGQIVNGHIWVADGYDDITTTIYTYTYHPGSPDHNIIFVYGPIQNTYYHFNWGWYGVCNGYFTGSVFNTDNVVFPDTPNNLAGCYFNANVGTITVWK